MIASIRRFLRRERYAGVLIRGSGWTLLARASGTLIVYCLHVLLARVMGVGQYGVYAFVFAWVTVLVLFGKMGTDTALIRFLPANRARSEWSAFRGILRSADNLVLVASTATGASMAVVALLYRNTLGPTVATTFYVGAVMVPAWSLMALRGAGLRALGYAALDSTLELVLRPACFAILVIVLALADPVIINGPVAMAMNALSITFCFLLGSILLRRRLPTEAHHALPIYHSRKWLAMALPVLLISGSGMVLKRTDTIMVGAILGVEEAGLYSAASRTATLMLFGLHSVNAVLAPQISSLHASRQRVELRRLLTVASWVILVLTFSSGLLLVSLGKTILHLFGSDFLAAYPILVILAVAQLFNALCGSVGFVMMMTGHQRPAAVIMLISTVLNGFLNLLLIKTLGIYGAAIATGAATILWNGAMFIYVLRRVGLNTSVFPLGTKCRRGRR